MKIYFFGFVLISSLFVACVKKEIGKVFEDKYDAPLKAVLNDPKYYKSNEPIRCIIEMYKNIDFILKDKLENVGLKVITTAGNVIVVEGTAKSIRKASRYDFVHRISLSTEKKLN
ncbi:MAG: hypothetical protein ACUVQ1_08905 [Candidatus Kapaibacteriales bacterium]